MKDTLIKIKQHPKYEQALFWGKLISITGSGQIIVQAVGFASGILVIRLLPTQEYALYTLANTMLGTMTVLADGGISTGVMVQGGKVWQDPEKLGVVLATGLDLRRKFALGSLIVSTPILLYLLLHNNASWLTAILIVLSLIPAFYAALSDSLLEIVPKLHQSILPLQKNQLKVGVGRLVLSTLMLFIFPWTFVAVLAGGIARIFGNIELKKIANQSIIESQPDIVIKKEILSLVRKTMPGLIYYCVSGQITIWILSIFGTTTSIAQIGALGRISVLLGIIGVIFSTILTPRFARLKENNTIIYKKYIQLVVVFASICLVLILMGTMFSTEILWILGPKYWNLNNELILSLLGSCIFSGAGFIYSLSSSRGFVLNPLIYISFSVISIVISVVLFNVSTLKGILYLNIFVSSVQLIMYILYSQIKFYKKNI